MRTGIILILLLNTGLLAFMAGCQGNSSIGTETADEPVVLAQGSTDDVPGYVITDTGEVIYRDSRHRLENPEDGHNPDFPPVFPGAQRIFPPNENPSERENYITRAPFEAIEIYYENFLGFGDPELPSLPEGEESVHVQTMKMLDRDGHRSTAMYLNKQSGPRGGLKVLIKDFPDHNGVQIVLTTLDASPVGINPFGYFLTPEEAEKMFAKMEAEEAERERIRKELESRTQNESGSTENSDNTGEKREEGANGQAGGGD
ncbi:MAG TPA: hypothetical protein ENN67_03885 [Firmicutes bacterium]|nr:hypothetical protein [Bacillota bacterium]